VKTILATLLIAVALPAHAEFMDGNTLLQRMNGEAPERVAAFGYIGGVADAMSGVGWCPTANVTLNQVIDLTRTILASVPEHRHQPADVYVRVALNRIAPCQKKGSAL
jgi:hypothetical protein